MIRSQLALVLAAVVCCGCSVVSDFGAYHFDRVDASSTDAGDLEQPDASSSSASTDAGALEQPDASSSSASTDAGALEQPDASSAGGAGVGGSGAAGAAGAPDCGVLDPSCHGCVAPTHWCAFQRLCGLPSQC